MKLQIGAAALTRESVYHARLRRLGTEDRWKIIQRSFESLDDFPAGLKKHVEILPC